MKKGNNNQWNYVNYQTRKVTSIWVFSRKLPPNRKIKIKKKSVRSTFKYQEK